MRASAAALARMRTIEALVEFVVRRPGFAPKAVSGREVFFSGNSASSGDAARRVASSHL